ncbi:PREDICTED: venom serine protease Bi-VSP-like isoform X2 [Papilio polytes]|uniref:venom serine protease Bi-VSP-like isoform X2 n=1 Tax=Papilio polytes TaxID=76194 RepID=UPI000675C3D0|nr:PREDICTED: venom serine protease Bi-VSP-like isoform X2 [Papilio polytes]
MAKDVFVLVCVALCSQLALCQFGFFPQREDRRFNVFGAVQNILENPRRTLQAVLNFGPDRNQNRPDTNGQNNFSNNNVPNSPFDSEGNSGLPTPSSVEENITPVPQQESNNNGIPVVPPTGLETNGIPTVPPPGVEVNSITPEFGSGNGNNGIPDVPPTGLETNGIPTVLPPGVEENNLTPVPQIGSGNVNGIPDVPPAGLENGIPTSPPIGFNDRNSGNSDSSVTEGLTTLAPLTPVPNTGPRNNFNFGSEGLFLETCQTPQGDEGSCVNLYQCEPYLKLLKDAHRTVEATQLLRKAHCGFEGKNPKVCCSRPGIPTALPTQAPVTEATTPTTEPPRPSAKSLTDDDYVDAFPDPPVCGTSSAQFTKVVGGVNAKLGDFPWMALLGYLYRGGPSVDWKCGGSLITSRHVLTAAHCIHGLDSLYLVRLGELDLEREDDGAAPIDVLIKRKIEHEDYSRNSLTNDIGVLVLQQDVTFTKLIHPICIPLAPELRSNSYVNYNPMIAGWGSVSYRGPSASHLQALQLPVVSNEYCARAYAAYKEQTIDERVLCAGYERGGRDSCQGDSGGPLMQPVWNSKNFTTPMYQIGVVSYGKQCAQAGFPGVYTRLTHFIPWLQEKVLGKPS